MGKFLNESPSGIWKDVWQTGHLIVAWSCLLAKPACLSRHSTQNEWRHGKVLGLLTVSKHRGHSASLLRFVKSCWTSMAKTSRARRISGMWFGCGMLIERIYSVKFWLWCLEWVLTVNVNGSGCSSMRRTTSFFDQSTIHMGSSIPRTQNCLLIMTVGSKHETNCTSHLQIWHWCLKQQ